MGSENVKPVISTSFTVLISDADEGDSSPEFFSSVEGLSEGVVGNSSLGMLSISDRSNIVLPSKRKSSRVILRRPLADRKSNITKWASDMLKNFSFSPSQMFVFIMSPENNVVAQWTLTDAYPISISVSDFHADSSKSPLVEEVIEIAFSSIIMDKPQ